MNLEKCKFNIKILEFLSYIISPDGVIIKASWVTAIKE